MTREEKEQIGKYVLQMARLLEDGCYQQEMLLKAVHIIDEALEQEPKTGHWINKYHSFESCSAECSSCHKRSNGYMHDNGFSLECKYYDFCPNCGARMIEPQESEDKE